MARSLPSCLLLLLLAWPGVQAAELAPPTADLGPSPGGCSAVDVTFEPLGVVPDPDGCIRHFVSKLIEPSPGR